MWVGIVAGFTVVALSGAAAFLSLRWALRKDPAFFVKVFLIGVLARLVLVGAAAFLILACTRVHRVAFAGSLIGFYLLFLAGESTLIHRLVSRERRGTEEDRREAGGTEESGPSRDGGGEEAGC